MARTEITEDKFSEISKSFLSASGDITELIMTWYPGYIEIDVEYSDKGRKEYLMEEL